MPRRANSPSPSDEEIMSYDSVPPEVAARYIRMSTPTIYEGLRQGRIPFGFAVENKETHTWTYNISPGGLVRYKQEGNPIIRLGEMREILQDSVSDYLGARMAGLERVIRLIMDG